MREMQVIRELLSEKLQLPLEYLDKIARTASRLYKTYSVPKRTGGYRSIHHPAKELKVLQRWLLHAVIRNWPVHPAAQAYEKGRSTGMNASIHASNSYLLRMDFTDFFPSMTMEDMLKYFKDNPDSTTNWDSRDIEFFIRIVCRHGQLTIGSPTSPRLSNVLCRQFDSLVIDMCDVEGVKYTRYADDLFFSTQRPNVLHRIEEGVVKILERIEYPANLRINSKKTHHSSKKGRRIVTGLVLTQGGAVSIGRAQKRYVRSQIHQFETLDKESRRRLAGYLAYVRSVEPAYINSLVIKFGPRRIRDARMGRNPLTGNQNGD